MNAPTSDDDPVNYFLVEKSQESKDDSHDRLTLAYNFEKSAIASSSVWNVTTSTLEVCQVIEIMYGNWALGFEDKQIVEEQKHRELWKGNDGFPV